MRCNFDKLPSSRSGHEHAWTARGWRPQDHKQLTESLRREVGRSVPIPDSCTAASGQAEGPSRHPSITLDRQRFSLNVLPTRAGQSPPAMGRTISMLSASSSVLRATAPASARKSGAAKFTVSASNLLHEPLGPDDLRIARGAFDGACLVASWISLLARIRRACA